MTMFMVKKTHVNMVILFSLIFNFVFGLYWVRSSIKDRQVKDKQLICGCNSATQLWHYCCKYAN